MRPPRIRIPASSLGQLSWLVAAFVIVTLIALAAGAANLGTALAFGAMGFALVLVVVLLFG